MGFFWIVGLACCLGQTPSDAFFSGPIPEIRLLLAPDAENALRNDPRTYVKAQFSANGAKPVEIGIKIKGAAGSTRPYDDRPALTLNMDKYHRGQNYQGMDKFHLNNSVQDPTYLNELIGSTISLAAKVPATRVTHARLRINKRDLGLFVLKEGFDSGFLKRHFVDKKGSLFDGGFLQDIDADLQRDNGPGPDDKRELKALLAACREPDPARRKIALEKVLDVEEMISFLAVEQMLGHWDGYARNRNNYRIYFHPVSKKAAFLPHGMDQLWENFPVMEPPGAIVAAAVNADPQWRRLYRKRVEALLPLFESKAIDGVIDPVLKRIKPIVASLGKDFANSHAEEVKGLRERIRERYQSMVTSLKERDPEPLVFGPEGSQRIHGWQTQTDQGEPKIGEVEIKGQKINSMVLVPNQPTASGWRTAVTLAKGKYRLEVRMKTTGIVPMMDEKGSGADLRISGEKGRTGLAGNNDWTVRTLDFEVTEPVKNVVLICEVHGKAGTLFMDPEAKIVKRQE